MTLPHCPSSSDRCHSLPTILLTGLLLTISGCQQQEASAPVTQDSVRPARIYEVTSPDDAAWHRFPGKVKAAEQAALAFRVPGELQRLPARAGQEVTQGEVLAQLDPADYQLRVDERQARFDLANSQFKRINNLYSQRQVSKAQFDQAKAELDISRTALTSAKTDLSYTVLKAPFTGTVSALMAENHQAVAAGMTVLAIDAIDQLEISIQVPETIMANISQGKGERQYQPQVEFDALPGQRFPSNYREHNTQADPATGSYQVILALPRPDEINVLPGMSASVYADLNQILALHHSEVVVPSAAVFQSSDQAEGSRLAQVWRLDENNRLQAQAVSLGKLTGNGIQILSGLKPGDRVLAAGVYQAQAGMTVRPWTQERGL